MAAITPTNPVTAVSSSASSSGTTAGSVTPVEASIGNAPDKIQQLTHQIQVTGLISQLPDGMQITLSTALGNLTILLPILAQDQQQKLEQQLIALFQSQKPLTVVVQPGNPPAQAFLLVPSAPGSATAGTGALPPLINAASSTLMSTQPLVPGALLPAVVLLPVDASASPGTLPAFTETLLLDELAVKAQAVAGQGIAGESGQILTNPTPLAGLPQAIPSSTPPAAPLFNPAAAVQPNTAASLPGLLQPGTELTLTVNTVALPSAAVPVPNLPNQIAATVIGSGPNGQLLLQAGDATLYVKQPANVPVGSTLLITIEPSRANAPTLLPMPDIGNSGTLQQVLATIAQADPTLARQIMESIIPQPNPALAGALFLLFAAFQQTDWRAWLGPSAADILSRMGKAELIAKLSQGLSEAGQAVHDPVVGAWRSYSVPLYANGQFQTLHFYVHGDRHWRGGQGGAEANSGAKSVRFLIDMRLSKLGAMQLDGFVRPQQLDMIIRSETMLPEGLDQNLRQTYANTLSAVGYAGTLSFQTGRQHWLFLRNPAMPESVVT